MIRFKAIVFDMDGTLLNTLEDLADSMNQVLRDKGFPVHPTEAYFTLVGSGAAKLVARALPKENRNEETIKECLDAFRAEYDQKWNKKTTLYEGIPGLLDALIRMEIPLCVLTNKPQNFAELCVRHFLGRWTFAMVIGQREGVPVKPDPSGPREIAASLNIPPEEFLYLGDTNVDMQTAINGGMFPVGVLWGFRSEQELRESGAQAIIAKPMEVMKFFG